MGENINIEFLNKCKKYADDMEKRVLSGKIITDIMYDDRDRIVVTDVGNGRFGYAVYDTYLDELRYIVEGDYLITNLKKRTDYKGQALKYEGAKSMIQRNMLGYFFEYIKDQGFEGFYINVQTPEDCELNVEQQMGGYDSQDPVTILYASFADKKFAYVAQASSYVSEKTGKPMYRLGLGTLNPDGTLNVDELIKNEIEAAKARRFFDYGYNVTRQELIDNVGYSIKEAQALFTPLFTAMGIPMYEGVEPKSILDETFKKIPKQLEKKEQPKGLL